MESESTDQPGDRRPSNETSRPPEEISGKRLRDLSPEKDPMGAAKDAPLSPADSPVPRSDA